MATTPFQRTLVDPAGLGRDAPFDAGPDSDKALLFLILSELRIISHFMKASIVGETSAEPVSYLREDNLIEPDFIRPV